MINPKFILFDAGNVLVRKKIYEGINIANELHFPPDKYDEILDHLIKTQSEEDTNLFWNANTLEKEIEYLNRLHKKMCEYLNIEYDDNLINKLTKFRTQGDFVLKEGVLETLEKLSKNFKLGVLTNALPSRRYHELKIYNIDKYFEFIIITWEEGLKKTDKEIYELAIKRSGVDPKDILFVDDKISFLEGAKSAGINNLILHKNKEISDKYPMIDKLSDILNLIIK